MGSLLGDVRYAARGLRRAPAFAATAVLCLALGIWLAGSTAATILSVTRPKVSYVDPERLVQLEETGLFATSRTIDIDHTPRIPLTVFADLSKEPLFAGIAQYRYLAVTVSHDDRTTRDAYAVSYNLFRVLGVQPALGRDFAREEDERGAGNIVMLGYSFWRSRFGEDSAILGKTLETRWGPHTIVGVMPRDFEFPPRHTVDLYVPLGSVWANRQPTSVTVLARLRDGISLERVKGVATTIAQQHIADDRDTERSRWAKSPVPVAVPAGRVGVDAWKYRAERIQDSGPILFARFLIGATIFVLLIACANVINLLLVRADARRAEMAIRTALGAPRARLVRQLLTESTLLAAGGTAVGLLFTYWHSQLRPAGPDWFGLVGTVDLPVLVVAVATGVVLVFVFGLVPALRVSRTRAESTLRDVRRGRLASSRLDRLMSRLVVWSVAITVVLVVTAGLFGAAAVRLMLSNPGYQRANVLAIQVHFQQIDLASPIAVTTKAAELMSSVSSLAAVQSVTVGPPPTVKNPHGLTVDREDHTTTELGYGLLSRVTATYFHTLRIPLVAGRAFADHEAREGTRVIVLSSTAAARLFPEGSSVGRRIRLHLDREPVGTEYTVIGIVTDVAGPTGLGGELTWPQVYLPYGLQPEMRTSVIVRLTENSPGVTAAVVAAIRAVHGVEVGEIATLGQLASRSGRLSRPVAAAFALFGVASLVLAGIGVYGVIAFAVARRTHEIGVRLALGADSGMVKQMLLRQGARLVGSGVVLGLLFAVGLAQILRGSIFGLSPTEPLVYGGAVVLIGAVAVLATYLPARRAARMDPVIALRAD